MKRGNMWGPFILFTCMIAFIIMIIVFMPLIFGEAESAANVTSMTNETRAAYNATSSVVLVSHEVMMIAGLIVAVAAVLFALYLFSRWR